MHACGEVYWSKKHCNLSRYTRIKDKSKNLGHIAAYIKSDIAVFTKSEIIYVCNIKW